jgi:hypothetical protein
MNVRTLTPKFQLLQLCIMAVILLVSIPRPRHLYPMLYGWPTTGSPNERIMLICAFRGRLHASDSTYDSPHDSAHDLHAKGLFRVLIIVSPRHQLQLLVNTYQEKLVNNYIANHLVQKIVHGIVRRFLRRIALVDGPL